MNWFKGRFKYAFQGLFYAFTCDRSIRLQGIFGLIVILCGILFHCSLNEWMMLIFAIGLVWFSEIINSCIERCVDYISLEHTEQAKHIKDMAAGVCLYYRHACRMYWALCIFAQTILKRR